jgi:hypothetical protein
MLLEQSARTIKILPLAFFWREKEKPALTIKVYSTEPFNFLQVMSNASLEI